MERDLVERAFEEYFAGQHADQSNPNFYVMILPLSRQFNKDLQFILGVAVGNSHRGLRALLEASGLRSYLFAVQTADEHPSKMNLRKLHQALVESGAGERRVVGKPFIIETGHALRVCWGFDVKWGYYEAHQLSGCTHFAQVVSEPLCPISKILKA